MDDETREQFYASLSQTYKKSYDSAKKCGLEDVYMKEYMKCKYNSSHKDRIGKAMVKCCKKALTLGLNMKEIDHFCELIRGFEKDNEELVPDAIFVLHNIDGIKKNVRKILHMKFDNVIDEENVSDLFNSFKDEFFCEKALNIIEKNGKDNDVVISEISFYIVGVIEKKTDIEEMKETKKFMEDFGLKSISEAKIYLKAYKSALE